MHSYSFTTVLSNFFDDYLGFQDCFLFSIRESNSGPKQVTSITSFNFENRIFSIFIKKKFSPLDFEEHFPVFSFKENLKGILDPSCILKTITLINFPILHYCIILNILLISLCIGDTLQS